MEKFDVNRAFDLLQRMDYVRICGSKEEKETALLLKSAIEKDGVKV